MTPFYEEIIYKNIELYIHRATEELKKNAVKSWNIADFIFSVSWNYKYKIIKIFGIKITVKK